MFDSLDAKKRKRISNILLVIAILLLFTGIVIISVDIAKKNIRLGKINEGVTSMDAVIVDSIRTAETLTEEQANGTVSEPTVTLIVDNNALGVTGEEYDFFGTDEEIAAQREAVENELDNQYTGYTVLQGIGILDIPAIDAHLPIWQTTNNVTLRYGTGHYVGSVMPGQVGNCSILGHHMRQYGSIFNRLEEVGVGDEITVTNLRGYQYTYIVDQTVIVPPEELGDYLRGGITDSRQITLVTCTYTSTGKQRFVVIGHIQDGQ
ncbi:MAG: class D sortase [Saccharofermentans sp.]|nr:class D sortase [Saccharofermentans sp.]